MAVLFVPCTLSIFVDKSPFAIFLDSSYSIQEWVGFLVLGFDYEFSIFVNESISSTLSPYPNSGKPIGERGDLIIFVRSGGCSVFVDKYPSSILSLNSRKSFSEKTCFFEAWANKKFPTLIDETIFSVFLFFSRPASLLGLGTSNV